MNHNPVLQKDIESVIEEQMLFEKLKSKAVLITGATGLIGSMLTRVLHAANEKYDLKLSVYAQIRNEEKAKTVLGSLTDADDIHFINIKKDSKDRFQYDFIIHTVSPTSSRFFIENPVETIKTSVGSTIDILEVAKENKASLVYLSSMEQYGVPYEKGQIMTEDKIGVIDHLNIRSSYSESKRLCECLCVSYYREYGADVKIARLAQTFGAGIPVTDNRMPMQFAKAVINKRDIILHTEGRSVSNFVYLTDALTGILTILTRGVAGEAYNVCNDKETRCVKDIADLIAKEVAANKVKVKIEIPAGVSYGYAPDVNMYLNSDKLKSLGWNAKVNMKEAYKRMIDYLTCSQSFRTMKE